MTLAAHGQKSNTSQWADEPFTPHIHIQNRSWATWRVFLFSAEGWRGWWCSSSRRRFWADWVRTGNRAASGPKVRDSGTFELMCFCNDDDDDDDDGDDDDVGRCWWFRPAVIGSARLLLWMCCVLVDMRTLSHGLNVPHVCWNLRAVPTHGTVPRHAWVSVECELSGIWQRSYSMTFVFVYWLHEGTVWAALAHRVQTRVYPVEVREDALLFSSPL